MSYIYFNQYHNGTLWTHQTIVHSYCIDKSNLGEFPSTVVITALLIKSTKWHHSVPFFYSVVKQLMLSLLRKGVIGETLDADVARFSTLMLQPIGSWTLFWHQAHSWRRMRRFYYVKRTMPLETEVLYSQERQRWTLGSHSANGDRIKTVQRQLDSGSEKTQHGRLLRRQSKFREEIV